MIPKPTNTDNCTLKLLYNGSKDGFRDEHFHAKCDNETPTITFIKSQGYDQIFGGYTEQTWDEVSGDGWKKDDNAFIFSLSHNEKFPVIDPQFAIRSSNEAFTFGEDIQIYYESAINYVEGYSWFPNEYKSSKFNNVSQTSMTYLAGSSKFQVQELEVYKVICS